MKTEKFRFLAGVVAAHPEGKVVGRTRLQKTIKLLQRVGLPTDYDFVLFFYGPYSEGIMADLGLLEVLGLVVEEEHPSTHGGTPYYTIQAKPEAVLSEVGRFHDQINMMAATNAVALELAATYDAFRETGSDHNDAMTRLRRKKGEKCTPPHVDEALSLLGNLGLANR
jgi:uncharacterized protein YwgA